MEVEPVYWKETGFEPLYDAKTIPLNNQHEILYVSFNNLVDNFS